MLFNSFNFIIFFFCVLLLLIIEQHTTKRVAVRNALLLVASYVFYGWFNLSFLLILLYVTLVNYATGALLSRKTLHRKATLSTGVVLSLLPLMFYKYSAFIVGNIQLLINGNSDTEFLGKWIMPIGISFFTFQALSYVVDVYRGDVKAQPKYHIVLLYASLFHQCIAGPIVRYRDVEKQLLNRRINIFDVNKGINRFCIGLGKTS